MEDGMPNSTIALTFDFDALSVWFGYPNTTPAMLARGEYGARVGVPRVLDLLRAHGIAATFFIPGHTIDSFPEQVATILDAGHEVAHHSYAHVDPSTQTPEAERRDLERALDALHRIGVHPVKLRGPDLQYLARSGRAVAIGVEVELEVDPVVELKRNRQLPELRQTALYQRLLLRDAIADAGTIGAEVVGHQARVIAEIVRFEQGEGGR